MKKQITAYFLLLSVLLSVSCAGKTAPDDSSVTSQPADSTSAAEETISDGLPEVD